MCVDPEWPQGVVQVESDQFWEWKAVGEGFGSHRGILQRLSVLALGSDHVWYKERTKNQRKFGGIREGNGPWKKRRRMNPGLDWHVKPDTDDDCDQLGNILIDKVGPSEVYNQDATY